jgi:hypothetical protein
MQQVDLSSSLQLFALVGSATAAFPQQHTEFLGSIDAFVNDVVRIGTISNPMVFLPAYFAVVLTEQPRAAITQQLLSEANDFHSYLFVLSEGLVEG